MYGLEAALAYLQERGLESIRAQERDLTARLLDGLSKNEQIQVFGPASDTERVGVVSIAIEGFEPQILATILDENFGIQTRAGLHCAPGVHKCIGTFRAGGTVRLSIGAFTTSEEIDATVKALCEIAG